MQNLPSNQNSLKSTPFDLAADFPVTVLRDSYMSDTPITYLHIHNCFEIGLCHEGCGVFMIGDRVMPFSAGDASFICAEQSHLGQATRGTSSRWTWILLDPVSLLSGAIGSDATLLEDYRTSDFSTILKLGNQPELVRMIECLVSELISQETGHASITYALVWAILGKLRQYQKKSGVKTTERRSQSRITPALNYVAQHYMQSISLAQLAGACNISVSYFRRIFVAAVGKLPLEYLNSYRVQMADALLQQTDKSVLEISLAVGFPSLSSFNRQFKQYFGLTPRERRRLGSSTGEAKGSSLQGGPK